MKIYKEKWCKGLVAIILVILCASCFSQRKTPYKRMRHFGDTTFKESFSGEMLDSLGMRSIENSTRPFNFRYSLMNTTVDLWSDDTVHYHCRVYCYINSENTKRTWYYGNCFQLTDSIANEIGNAFQEMHIAEIPPEETILGVPTGNCADCSGALFEFSDGKHYSRKLYLSIYSHAKTIREAGIIDSFSNFIEKTANVNAHFNDFLNTLPKGFYREGVMTIGIF